MYITPKAIKGQAITDLLAYFPNGEFEPPLENLAGDELDCALTEGDPREWTLSFDGSSTYSRGEARINLTSQTDKLYLSYKLDFKCSNNESEYKALILGFLATTKIGVLHLRNRDYSNLVVK